jgi:hypothetical protein
LVARLAPAGLDPGAVGHAAASIGATGRLHALTQRIIADIDYEAWSPAPADLVDLQERLDGEWALGARRSDADSPETSAEHRRASRLTS